MSLADTLKHRDMSRYRATICDGVSQVLVHDARTPGR